MNSVSLQFLTKYIKTNLLNQAKWNFYGKFNSWFFFQFSCVVTKFLFLDPSKGLLMFSGARERVHYEQMD